MNDFVTVVNTVGFPIACVIALGWYSLKTTSEVIKLTERVTSALEKSADKLEDLARAIESMNKKGE